MTARTTSNRIYARVSGNLQERIASGEFEIGARLPPERELAQAYNVSRPTIREAIIALEVDGVVSVRQGSGVYVTAKRPRTGIPGETDIGPFELLEARRAIEAEACALAATQIDSAQLHQLDALVEEMRGENLENDIPRSEQADRQFHRVIAEASGNSAMVAVVDMLWDMRFRSPQSRMLTTKAHAAGVKPRVEEHVAIVDALKRGNADLARAAMRLHLGRVLDTLLETTEIHEIDQARERVQLQRKRYARR
ncbi:MAG: FadR family transcriptional regulator [Sphingomonas sp.]|nr:MAG: FadR family transcriptional regulator [Sphingomonas sp.]